jgi:hypothetical protein
MARITVELSEADIRAAVMDWAVTRVLNEGKAVDCELSVTVCEGKPTGTINTVRVEVETDRMAKPLPTHVASKESLE